MLGRSARLGSLVAILVLAFACTGRAAAPYMGVDAWYAFGPSINERDVVALTNVTVARGLKMAGYRYIWIDAGWWWGKRRANGRIDVNRSQWPHGMAWLTHYIHSKGLLAGIYANLGVTRCYNGGSLGHYQQDVNQFAAWGFDAVKGDFCGAYLLPLNPQTAFTAFSRAIRTDKPHRRMILTVANADTWSSYPYTTFADWSWAPRIAASWRTEQDLSYPGPVTWAHLLRNIAADAAHPEAAGNGHWNDPDFIVPAEFPRAEARAQLTMWVILAAPMMVSADIGRLPSWTIRMLTNRAAIAISQDPLGRQGTLSASSNGVQVWVKPLADGSKAVAVLNRAAVHRSIVVTGHMVGFGAQRLLVRRIWGRVISGPEAITVRLGGESAALLRVLAH
jgi:alpha-galactosidase